MMNLNENLILEIEKFNKMIENSDGQIFNDSILEQSIKLDKLILAYTKSKLEITHEKLEILLQIIKLRHVQIDSKSS